MAVELCPTAPPSVTKSHSVSDTNLSEGSTIIRRTRVPKRSWQPIGESQSVLMTFAPAKPNAESGTDSNECVAHSDCGSSLAV